MAVTPTFTALDALKLYNQACESQTSIIGMTVNKIFDEIKTLLKTKPILSYPLYVPENVELNLVIQQIERSGFKVHTYEGDYREPTTYAICWNPSCDHMKVHLKP